jgi:hypothetical protein
VDSRQQHYFIKSKLYRKSELIDLISAVSKLKTDDQNYNEMQMKKEKMQAELMLIEDALFDLMKNKSKEIENSMKEQEEMDIDSEDNTKVNEEDYHSQSSPTESEHESPSKVKENELTENEVRNEVLEKLDDSNTPTKEAEVHIP